MAKRKIKNNQGKYKAELQNEPIKIMLNSHEHDLLKFQVATSDRSQSEYLRYLLLVAPDCRAIKIDDTCDLTDRINELGYRLNTIAKNINQALLADETIAIATSETIFRDIYQNLLIVKERIPRFRTQKELVRNIQVKFLVTPTQLKIAKAKLEEKKLNLSRYLRQQITGYREVKHKNKAEEVNRAVGRLGNNINQIATAIALEEKAHRLVIVAADTKLEITTLQRSISSLQQLLLGNSL